MKTVKTIIFILVLSCLIGCEQLQLDNYTNYPLGDWTTPTLRNRAVKNRNISTANSSLSEVTSPQIIQELKQELVQYSPKVKIIEPQAGKTFNQTEVTLKLAVEDLPIFQDDRLHLGNHLNLIVDNGPLQSIYSLDEPIIIKNLEPGTHFVRAFAVSPWGESFKNQGAYAQTTFNVLTQTNTNQPNPELPLLTYNSPTGTYGAEPVLLDFYLNSPDQAIAFPSSNDDNQPWQVKATINGTSFMIKDWQPYYLTGFKPGENWVQLELLDQSGNAIANTFNNTVRMFTFNPQPPENLDNLGKLVTNQIAFNDAQSIVNQSYYIQSEENKKNTPETTETTSEITNVEDAEVEVEPKNKLNNTNSDSAPVAKVSPSVKSKDKLEISNQSNQASQLLPSKVETNTQEEIEPAESTSTKPSPKETSISENLIQERVLDQVSEPKSVTSDNIYSPKITETEETAKLSNKTTTIELEPKPTINKILITESNSPTKAPEAKSPETLAEIIIPTSESIEIVEPDVESNDYSFDSESTVAKPLWWKKILVKVRQTIEALARQLPNEV